MIAVPNERKRSGSEGKQEHDEKEMTIAALKGDKTLAELALQFGVHPN